MPRGPRPSAVTVGQLGPSHASGQWGWSVGSIFKRKRRGRESLKWTIKFRDANGRWRTETAYVDKGRSKRLLAKREAAVAEGREPGDPYREHRRKPLTEHVAEFLRHLAVNGCCERYVRHVGEHLRYSFGWMSATRLPEVTTDAMRGLLDHLGTTRRHSTRNHYLGSLRAFFRWLVAEKRWPDDITRGFRQLNVLEDEGRTPRRPLTADELARLVAAARERPEAEYARPHPDAPPAKLRKLRLRGLERATAYTVAALQGLRKNECRELTWGDLRLDAEPPLLIVRAKASKAKRQDPALPLAAATVAMLREWRAAWMQQDCETGAVFKERRTEPPPSAPVFPHVITSMLNRALRKDCQYARPRIPVEDERGRVCFHALRHTAGTLLAAAGVHPKTTQALMRHSDIRTTFNLYVHQQEADRLDAVDRLPGIGLAPAVEGKRRSQGGRA